MALLAFLSLVFIWSTTPLAIQYSNDSVTPIASLVMRMLIAVALGTVISLLLRHKTVWNMKNCQTYLIASFGIFPNIAFVYYATELLPSGTVAVLFGLTPFMTSVVAHFVLHESMLTWRKCSALVFAISGLLMIFYSQLQFGDGAIKGVLLMICSSICFSVSSVWVKKMSLENLIHPFDQSMGAMVFALPGLLVGWLILDGNTQIVFSEKSLLAISYLAVVATLLNFYIFFYILNRLSVGIIAMIPVFTPVAALWIGAVAANESISQTIIIGTALILSGLLIHEGLLFKTKAEKPLAGG